MSTRRIRSTIVLSIALIQASMHAAVSAYAQSPLDDGIDRLAAAVGEVFEREGEERTVMVASILGIENEGNAMLREMFVDALKQEDFSIQRSTLTLSGKCSKHFGPTPAGPKAVALDLKAEIRNRITAQLIQAISIPIFDQEAVLQLYPTVELPAGKSERERQEILNSAIDFPSVALVGSQVKPQKSSQYAVEILVHGSDGNTARHAKDRAGLAYVDLQQGEEYLVRLYNGAEHETAVSLNIDGLNMFAFSEQGDSGQVLIAPNTYVDVPGWVITNAQSDAFEITTYAKSAAAEKRIPRSDVGTITAAFHAAWNPSQPPPADEANAKSADKATGRGHRIDQEYKSVKRVIGKQRAMISIRYNR